MVTSLEWLDASTEKDLQQVHTSHSVADKLDDPLDQHLHLCLLFWDRPQGGGLLHSIQRKGGKSSRLTRGRLVLAVKPGRLLAPDRVGKDHSWEGALVPHLDSKAPAHLYHVRPLVTLVGLLNRLGATCEYVLEETPVRSATQETLAHGHEGSKVHDGVWREVVELSPKEVQESAKKGGEAKKTRGRHGWQGERTHPPAAAARSCSPGAALIHGGSVPPQPDLRCRLG